MAPRALPGFGRSPNADDTPPRFRRRQDATDSLAILVRQWGHEVRIARDATTALAFVEAQCPDAVLLDLAMPGMSGPELATKLRKFGSPKTPMLVAVTDCSDTDTRAKVAKAEAHFYIARPVSPDLLRTLLERVECGWPLDKRGSAKTVADLIAEVRRDQGQDILFITLELAGRRRLTVKSGGQATITHPDGRVEEVRGDETV